MKYISVAIVSVVLLSQLASAELIWKEDFGSHVGPIYSLNSSVNPWRIRDDNGSYYNPTPVDGGVIATNAFLGCNWDNGIGDIWMEAFPPIGYTWTNRTIIFDWYVPDADSPTSLTVEWRLRFIGIWKPIFSGTYQPASGMHMESIPLNSINGGIELRFIPSGGNGRAGIAVRGLGEGVQIYDTVETVTADRDEDGIDDAWETVYFPNLEGCNPDDNPDEDSYTNLEEFQGKTNPLVWELFLMSSIGPNFELKWKSITGSTYQVQTSYDLHSNSWVNAGDVISGNGETNKLALPITSQQNFFRVITTP